MKWLAECAAAALAEALRVVAPEQRGCPVTVPGPVAEDDPLRGVIQCAHRQAVHREVRVVSPGRAPPGARDRRADRVRSRAGGPVPARGGRPHRLLLLLLVTRLVPGESLFEGVGSIERDGAGRQLARFLAALQQPAPVNVPRLPSASCPARHCRLPRREPYATGSPRGSGRISTRLSCAGATGPGSSLAGSCRPAG